MGHESTARHRAARATLGICATAIFLFASANAQAIPFHPRKEALDVTGLNHACGAAVDSKGDFYASSAGESKVKVYNAAHTLLTSIVDSNEPCGLAVTSTGVLYVSEKATGNVVRFHPNEYPPTGATTYTETTVDASGKAKGIAVDGFDDGLYVAEGNRVSSYVNELQTVAIENSVGGAFTLEFGGQKTPGGRREVGNVTSGSPTVTSVLAASGTGTLTSGSTEVALKTSAGEWIAGESIAGAGIPPGTTVTSATESILTLSQAAEASGTGVALSASGPLPFAIGEAISGPGIPAGTTIQSLGPGTITLSANATASATAATLSTGLPFNATAAEVQTALEALSTIGAGNVEVTKPSSFSVFFVGKFAHEDVPPLIGDPSGLVHKTSSPPAPPVRARVSERSQGRSAHIGEGMLTEASGVAAFSYSYKTEHHSDIEHFLWVADAKGPLLADRLYLFRAQNANVPTFSGRELDGATTPDGSFGFGPSGAYLAADPGNRDTAGSSEPFNSSTVGKCKAVGEQACTAGHLFLYDAAHKALDEFDASGDYLDQTRNAAFADAEPSAIAIDRSGVAEKDGSIYVTAGAGAGAKAIAFGPLKAPKREALKLASEGGPSQLLNGIRSVATDSHGDVYATAGESIHIYSPSGAEITTIVDSHKPQKVAVDSTGVVYVVDENNGEFSKYEATYYTPNANGYPPKSTTTYTRRSEPILTPAQCPEIGERIKTVAVNPGPGTGKDHLFVICGDVIRIYDSAANGSGLLVGEFGKGLVGDVHRESIAVNGATGTVYVGENQHVITAIDEATGKFVSRFEDTGFTSGAFGVPSMGLDQSSGHVVEFDGANHGAREYDPAGSFVAEFGTFTEEIHGVPYGIAVDNACALHEPEPLTGEACKAYDPANGTLYVAFADTHKQPKAPALPTPPYNGVNAFGPLKYDSTPAKHKVTVSKSGNGSGTVTSTPAGISCGLTCTAEFEETEVVTLEAQAAALSEFTGWSGCEAEPSPTKCEVTPSKDREVSAHFDHVAGAEFPLEVVFEGPGSGEVSSTPDGIECSATCSAEFPEATVVTLEANAPQGSEFLSWTGCESEPSPGKCEVTMSEAKQVKVKFGVEHPKLTVAKEGNGEGTVTSAPAGIDCGATCTHKFDLGEEVTLSAQASPGSVFEGWEGCEEEPSPSECEVTMSEATEVQATFLALPGAQAEQAVPVLYTEATLHGKVDPAGLLTEYRFEYLSEPEYEANGESFKGAKATPSHEAGPAAGFLSVEAPIAALQEGTEYRFRLRATNPAGLVEDEGSFETLQRRAPSACANDAYRFGLSSNLPDCRAYELTTPGQTDGLKPYAASYGGGDSRGLNDWLTVQRGEGAGERLTYFTDGTLPGFEGNGVTDGYRAQRGSGDHPPGGWQSEIFSPNYEEAAPSLLKTPNQLGVTPDQLYSAWEIVDGVETFPGTLPSGTYLRTPAGFEALGQGSLGTDLGALRRYLSPGGEHVIFASSQHLEEKAAPPGTAAIYDRAAGQSSSEVISVKPDGSPFGAGKAASYAGATEDGSAVAFSAEGALYLHREGKTSEIATSPAIFAGISEDGKRVFYAAGDGESPAGLFACDTEAGPCAGAGSHPATKLATSAIFAMVSPDGSGAFFSSTEALSGAEENENGEEALPGAHNLYAWDGSATRFVGRLSAADFANDSFDGIAGMNLSAWTRAIAPGNTLGRALAPTRSTPGGGAILFQSHARLSAYDNEGKGEIYRYDPSAPAGQRLLCLSCDPSGAPPTADALLEDIGAVANVPVQQETMIANLSDDGQRAFFQSFDRLLPEDANETEDVYEWEAQGTEGCTRASGCLSLISSGQGETPSFLYAMSADGHDVFFQTKEKLLGIDVPGSPSIYDARVGGGIPEPSPPAPCQGDACQGVGALPPVLPNPASSGGGEGEGEGAPPPSCAKGKHRVKGRCVVAKHRKKRHAKKHRRASSKRGGGG